MANSLQPLSFKVPAHIAQLNRDVLDSGVVNAGREYPTVTLKGRRFSTIDLGGQVTELSGDYIDVVVVDGSPGIGRQFYDGVYDPQNPKAPVCWSEDGREPEAAVQQPQAASCAVCALAEKGSGNQGKGSACRTAKALVLYFANDPERTLYRLTLSALSLFAPTDGKPGYLPWVGMKSNMGYTRYLRENGIEHFSAAITRIAFARADVPHVGFKAVELIDESDVEFLNALKPPSYENMLKIVSMAEQAEAGQTAQPGAREAKAAPAARGRRVEEEEDEPAPARGRGRPATGRDTSQEEEDDPEPAPTRRKKAPAARAARVSDADEAPPARGRSAAAPKGRQIADEDEPAPARRSAVPSKLHARTIEEDGVGDDSDELTRQLLAMGQS